MWALSSEQRLEKNRGEFPLGAEDGGSGGRVEEWRAGEAEVNQSLEQVHEDAVTKCE